MFDRVLVANRGEIAARILTTLREMGVGGVGVHAADDAQQPHTRLADETVALGGGPPGETYMDVDALVQAALDTGCDALHPGYGFLSEDAAFAEAVREAGLTWIGPPPSALELLGDKARALDLADELGLPTTPGSDGPVGSVGEARAAVEEAGVPSVVKAVHGGGGMGMVKVDSLDEVEDAYHSAREQAEHAFGNPEVMVERWWEAPRHLEVQVAFPREGEGVHLYTRECSLQRRNQKLVEEAPAPNLPEETRQALRDEAVLLCQAADVTALATVEFLVTGEGHVFNEVNPRLQVEHPVTEQVTGTALVEWQVRLAAGQPVPTPQDEIPLDGWSIEARINAEDPLDGFQPAPGPVTHVHVPQGEGLRVDHALVPGGSVSSKYDSLVAKVVATADDREAAIERLRDGLERLRVGSRPTTAGFLHQLVDRERVRAAEVDTNFVDEAVVGAYREAVHGAMATAVAASEVGDEGEVRLDGHLAAWTRKGEDVAVDGRVAEPAGDREGRGRVRLDGRVLEGQVRPSIATRSAGAAEGQRTVESPIAGTVDELLVAPGDGVEEGTELVVVEAMKMKNRIGARGPGVVDEVVASEGDTVTKGDPLLHVDAGD
jgi:acetyl/propionyl-CoA carboxylase alpha subunit